MNILKMNVAPIITSQCRVFVLSIHSITKATCNL